MLKKNEEQVLKLTQVQNPFEPINSNMILQLKMLNPVVNCPFALKDNLQLPISYSKTRNYYRCT